MSLARNTRPDRACNPEEEGPDQTRSPCTLTREDAGEAEDEDEEAQEEEETPVGEEEEETGEVMIETDQDSPVSTAEEKVTRPPTARAPRNPEERSETRGTGMEKGEKLLR